MTTYNYIYYRQEYPQERGYRMHTQTLPDWIKVKIEQHRNGTYSVSKKLYVESRLHVNKRVKLGPDYSVDYPNRDILIELSAEISRRWW